MSALPVDPLLQAPLALQAPVRTAGAPAPASAAARAATGGGFAGELARAGAPDGLKVSGHAAERLAQRGISLQGETGARLQDGVERAAAKGARESVVLVDGTAFVVSVANRTLITAVPPERMRGHVFTNVDSAVIA